MAVRVGSTGVGTDAAVLAALGAGLARRRVERSWTQAELAHEAGVSLRTVTRLEGGASVQLTNLVRVLRVLGLAERLAELVPREESSPLARLRAEKKVRRRVRKTKADPSRARESEWCWGDENEGAR